MIYEILAWSAAAFAVLIVAWEIFKRSKFFALRRVEFARLGHQAAHRGAFENCDLEPCAGLRNEWG